MRNPFNPERPPQEVEGERRQPVFNQRMITKIREASGGNYGYEDSTGIPDIPQELLQDGPPRTAGGPPPPDQFGSAGMPARRDAPPKEEGGMFSGWFSSEPDPMTTYNAPPQPGPDAQAVAREWVAPQQPAPMAQAAPQQPAGLTTVPPRPDEFETVHRNANQHINSLKQDYEAAQMSRSQLYDEPTQQAASQPVEMPAPRPAPAAVPVASPPPSYTPPPMPPQPQGNRVAGYIDSPPVVENAPMPPAAAYQPPAQEYSPQGNMPRRGVDIMTQEEWQAYIQGGEILNGYAAPQDSGVTPAPMMQPSAPPAAPSSEYEQPLPTPTGWNAGPQSALEMPLSGVAASGDSSADYLVSHFEGSNRLDVEREHALQLAQNDVYDEKNDVYRPSAEKKKTAWPRLAPVHSTDAKQPERPSFLQRLTSMSSSSGQQADDKVEEESSGDWLGALLNRSQEDKQKPADNKPQEATVTKPAAVAPASDVAASGNQPPIVLRSYQSKVTTPPIKKTTETMAEEKENSTGLLDGMFARKDTEVEAVPQYEKQAAAPNQLIAEPMAKEIAPLRTTPAPVIQKDSGPRVTVDSATLAQAKVDMEKVEDSAPAETEMPVAEMVEETTMPAPEKQAELQNPSPEPEVKTPYIPSVPEAVASTENRPVRAITLPQTDMKAEGSEVVEAKEEIKEEIKEVAKEPEVMAKAEPAPAPIKNAVEDEGPLPWNTVTPPGRIPSQEAMRAFKTAPGELPREDASEFSDMPSKKTADALRKQAALAKGEADEMAEPKEEKRGFFSRLFSSDETPKEADEKMEMAEPEAPAEDDAKVIGRVSNELSAPEGWKTLSKPVEETPKSEEMEAVKPASKPEFLRKMEESDVKTATETKPEPVKQVSMPKAPEVKTVREASPEPASKMEEPAELSLEDKEVPKSMPQLEPASTQTAAPVPQVQIGNKPPTAENAGVPEQGALPSPKILQEFKMLPPSRYNARKRADRPAN